MAFIKSINTCLRELKSGQLQIIQRLNKLDPSYQPSSSTHHAASLPHVIREEELTVSPTTTAVLRDPQTVSPTASPEPRDPPAVSSPPATARRLVQLKPAAASKGPPNTSPLVAAPRRAQLKPAAASPNTSPPAAARQGPPITSPRPAAPRRLPNTSPPAAASQGSPITSPSVALLRRPPPNFAPAVSRRPPIAPRKPLSTTTAPAASTIFPLCTLDDVAALGDAIKHGKENDDRRPHRIELVRLLQGVVNVSGGCVKRAVELSMRGLLTKDLLQKCGWARRSTNHEILLSNTPLFKVVLQVLAREIPTVTREELERKFGVFIRNQRRPPASKEPPTPPPHTDYGII